jgi:hypothetical protein
MSSKIRQKIRLFKNDVTNDSSILLIKDLIDPAQIQEYKLRKLDFFHFNKQQRPHLSNKQIYDNIIVINK